MVAINLVCKFWCGSNVYACDMFKKKINQKTNKNPWQFVQIISELEVENMCLSMSPYSSPFYRQELPGEASHYARYVEIFAKWNKQVLAPTTAF